MARPPEDREGSADAPARDQGVCSVTATGDTASVGGAATLSISAECVDEVVVRQLWTDWVIDGVEADGGTVRDEVGTDGRCRFQWDSTRRSVSLSVTLGLPVRYLGGAYGVVVGATSPTDSAETATTITVESVGTHDFAVETVAAGFTRPWGIAFLPDDTRLLVTERVGRLALADRQTGTVESVAGVPDVDASGQGGLLDVTLHPEYPARSWVYLTYAAANASGESATHLGRGRLDPDAGTLSAFEELHVAEPFVDSAGHYGSRVVFGTDGLVYVTSGDRQFKDFGPDHVAQDTGNELGATLRLEPDGSIPDGNPFVDDDGARDALFSYGHRNSQGMTIHPDTGEVWQSEHGERDGDELNVVEAGGNYGWPVASEACEYGTDDPVGVPHDERADVTNPVHYWPCGSGGFPPAGLAFYDGDAFPNWTGDLFVGTLGGTYLARFVVDGRDVAELDPLLTDRGWRIRDVAQAPDTGHLYVAVDGAPAPLVRLVPA